MNDRYLSDLVIHLIGRAEGSHVAVAGAVNVPPATLYSWLVGARVPHNERGDRVAAALAALFHLEAEAVFREEEEEDLPDLPAYEIERRYQAALAGIRARRRTAN